MSIDDELFIEGDSIDTPDGTVWPTIVDLADSDSSFPQPVGSFRAGRVWLADAVRRWQDRKLPPRAH